LRAKNLQIHEKANFYKFRFPFSAFRFPNGVAGATAPARPSRRRFSLRFIEKKNGGGTKMKSFSFLTKINDFSNLLKKS